jgi:hypothetical protein
MRGPLQAFLDFHRSRNRAQIGDPTKLGKVHVHLAEVDDPPVSFVAVADRQTSAERWRGLSVSSDGAWSAEE